MDAPSAGGRKPLAMLSFRRLAPFALRRGLLFPMLLPAFLHAKPSWQTVNIPVLPEGASLGGVWAAFSGDIYVWARTQGGPSGDVPTAHLVHWNGERWKVDLDLPGHDPGAVFGTDADNVFITTNKCVEGKSADCGADRGGRLFRSTDRGATWTPQALSPEAEGRALGMMQGSFENVQVVLDGASVLRFDGKGWSPAFKGGEQTTGRSLALSFQGVNEGYLVTCKGWGRWIDGAWKFMPVEFGFCDARGLWGLRDKGGGLRLYAVDDNRFSNGVRVWKFNPPVEDFEPVFEEASEDDWGRATALWGSAEDDIYVVGQIGDGTGAGRVYHYNGANWSRETSMGPIPPPGGLHGTSRNDVWITLSDGRLLHLSTAVSLTNKMTGPPSTRAE